MLKEKLLPSLALVQELYMEFVSCYDDFLLIIPKGFETAKLLAGQGCLLSICDVNGTALATCTKEIQDCASSPSNILSTVVDVRKVPEVDAWIDATVAKFGKLDGGINMAGVIPKVINIERVEDLNDEDWKFVIDVNLHGVMHCMRAQLRNMNVGGSIVNAASICGVIGFPKNAAYTATKHAVIGLSRTAAKEVGVSRSLFYRAGARN
jgi:NAD(P)-dependent dehydrogenase (short-subunit alcohol dehydrogenase family)